LKIIEKQTKKKREGLYITKMKNMTKNNMYTMPFNTSHMVPPPAPFASGSMKYPPPSALEKEFLEAAKKGDIGTLKLLANRSINPSTIRDKDGLTAFHYAASGDSVEAMEFLKACGCKPMERDGRGGTCIHEAADTGSLNALKWMAKNGTRGCVAEADARGDTAVHVACGKGHAHLLDFLLEQKCNLEAKTLEQNSRPLLYAITRNRGNCLKWLIEQGVNLSADDNCFKWNGMLCAAYNNSIECIRLIAKAKPELLETKGSIDNVTPEKIALNQGNTAASKLIKQLLKEWKSKTGNFKVDTAKAAKADAAANALLAELEREETALEEARKKKKKKKKKKKIISFKLG